jgi:hypothetical protein
MILRLVIPKVGDANTLQKHAEGCCPHSCPSVEVDADLARIVASWRRMTSEQKGVMVELASIL